MSKTREYPQDPTKTWWQQRSSQTRSARRRTPMFQHRPDTWLEAVMEQAPGAQRADTLPLDATNQLREALADAIDQLGDEDRWIIDRLFIEGMSLRKTGAVLSIPKTTLARRRDAIRRFLLVELAGDPRVRQWLL